MSKYTRIPFFTVGENEPVLLLMLDGNYDTNEWFVRTAPMPTKPAFDDES